MFNYKYPLLEVVQAIEHLQESKGTTNTQVCELVQKMANKPNNPIRVLKTVCTLNKLVEEGVLVKKGRRYSLPRPPPKNEDDEMEQEEEKNDECDEDDDDNMKDSCDDLGADDDEENCPEGDDDNGDDDDDDDDEDDDDDDDDDDDQGETNKDEDDDDENCNDKAEDNKKEEKKEDCPDGDTEADNRLGSRATGNRNGSGFPNQKGCNGELTCSGSNDNTFGVHKNLSTKKSKKHSKIATKAENIAFCARDFMDSQYRSFPKGSARMEDVMEEDEKVNEKTKEVANILQARRRGSRSRQSQLSNPNYRSRSPVKGAAMDALQHRLAMEASDEIGPLKSFIKEAKDMELDLEPNKHEDFELFDRRSPIDSHLPNASKSVVNVEESCENDQEKKEVKPEPVVASLNHQFGLKNQTETAFGVLKCKECKSGKIVTVKRGKRKKEASHTKRIYDSKKSVCSVCEKKKRKKKN